MKLAHLRTILQADICILLLLLPMALSEPWFTYTDDLGQSHEVWYADGASVAARLALVQRYGLGGIAVWRLGGEDPASWSAIATTLHPIGLHE